MANGQAARWSGLMVDDQGGYRLVVKLHARPARFLGRFLPVSG